MKKGVVESYCGLLCSECGFRERFNCPGCLEAKGRPFHGECRVAVCCLGQGHAHCGGCGRFPCVLLNEFAYDKEHGDNGRRIDVLRLWADVKEEEEK